MIKQDTETQKNNPFVDIILPNYNKNKYLAESVNSVINQTYKNWKLFIVDDHSTDNSREILKKYKNDNIKIIYLSKNKGVSLCRNLAMRKSNSKYIAFIDSDDYWSSDKLKKQIEFMEKFNHPFTYTNYTPFTIKNEKIIFLKEINAPKTFNFNQFINNTSIGMSSVIIERSLVGTTRFRKLKICEDYFFKCQILKKNIAIKLDKNTMFYRITKGSLQSNKLRNLYSVWNINKTYNHLSFFKNLKSLLLITIHSIKKYGIK